MFEPKGAERQSYCKAYVIRWVICTLPLMLVATKHSSICLVGLGWELSITPHIANVGTRLGTHFDRLELRRRKSIPVQACTGPEGSRRFRLTDFRQSAREGGKPWPPLWSSGQSLWLQIQRSRVRSPALPDFLSSSRSGTGSTQSREVNWGATWMKKVAAPGLENRD